MPDIPIIDRDVLDELVGHIGNDAARSVLALFVAESEGFVATVRGGGDAARRAAHSLKSSAGQVGAAALADAARRVEAALENGEPDAAPLVAALAECAATTKAALAAWLEG